MIERKKLNCKCSTCIYRTQGKIYKRLATHELKSIIKEYYNGKSNLSIPGSNPGY